MIDATEKREKEDDIEEEFDIGRSSVRNIVGGKLTL